MRSRAVVAFLLVVLASLTAAPSGRGAVDAPRWTVGDFWEYDVTTVVEAGLVLNGTLRAAVTDVGPKTVKGVPLTAFKTVLTGGGQVWSAGSGPQFSGQWSFVGDEWVEAGGYKIVQSVTQIDATGAAQPLDVGFTFQVQNTTESRVTSDTWGYPIDVGKTGKVVTNTTSTETVRFRSGNFSIDTSSTATYVRTLALNVTNASHVQVTAGAFDALVINVTWPTGEVDRWDYAPAVGNNARTETRNSTGAKVAESTLRAFLYQAGEKPPSFLGLPPLAWYGALAAASAASAVAVLLIRRRRRHAQEIEERTARDLGRPPGPT